MSSSSYLEEIRNINTIICDPMSSKKNQRSRGECSAQALSHDMQNIFVILHLIYSEEKTDIRNSRLL